MELRSEEVFGRVGTLVLSGVAPFVAIVAAAVLRVMYRSLMNNG